MKIKTTKFSSDGETVFSQKFGPAKISSYTVPYLKDTTSQLYGYSHAAKVTAFPTIVRGMQFPSLSHPSVVGEAG